MVALILAGGEAPTREHLDTHWPDWAASVDLVIAADSGARHAADLGLIIDRWVGDGDSIDAGLLDRLVAEGVAIERSPVDKDESDTELAIRAALTAGATAILILGATGGRIDHELANLGLLAMPELAAVPTVIYTPGSRLRLRRGPTPDWVPVSGRPGDLVSLLPVDDVVREVETRDLRYPLTAEDLRLGAARGLSNVIAGSAPAVRWRDGRLLVIETPATIDR